MKIAYVLNTYPQPSHSFIRREIRALEAQGNDVFRFAMRSSEMPLVDPQDKSEAEKTEYVLAEGVFALLGAVWHRLRVDTEGFWKATRAAWQLGGLSKVGRFRHLIYLFEAAYIADRTTALDVSHLHAHFGTNAAAVAMLAHLMGGPDYSFTVHGPEEFDAPHALGLARKMQHAAFTVAISNYGRSQLCRWADPQDWDRIKVVHCGIEADKLSAVTAPPKGPRRLVSIGRFVEQKGQLALVTALAQTESDIQLTLIGDGPMRQEIETLIAELGLRDRVTLAGWLNELQIAHELEKSHGLVMSSFAEGLPVVIMEAMAAARPVIATYIAGIPELVQDGKTGWLVPAGDVQALAVAMDALAKAPLSKLIKFGELGRIRVMERHDAGSEARRLAAHMR